METYKADWQEDGTLYMVCTSCYKRLYKKRYDTMEKVQEGVEKGEKVRLALKTAIYVKNLAPKHRAISVSCLGICPDEEVIFAKMDLKTKNIECLADSTEVDPETVVKELLP